MGGLGAQPLAKGRLKPVGPANAIAEPGPAQWECASAEASRQGSRLVAVNSTIDLSKGSYTYSDLELLPQEERSRYELSYGVLVVTPAPNTVHQLFLGRLTSYLRSIALPSQEVLPEAELLIRPDLVKRPDIQIVDSNLVGGQSVAGRPHLVVEILSPATRKIDLTEKRSVYEDYRIPAYWIVDPEVPSLTVLELDQRYLELPEQNGHIEITVPATLRINPAQILGRSPNLP